MAINLVARARQDGVKFVCLQFTDVVGTIKSVDIPVHRLPEVIADGIWFDGSSVEGFARIQESDMLLRADAATYRVFPWSEPERRRARVFCDVFGADGKPFDSDPRGALKRILAKARARGWEFNTGPELEFFLFRRNGGGIHPVPYDTGSYFDFSARDEAQRVRNQIISNLIAMGLNVEMGHHEVALGQHEIDFQYAEALTTADNAVAFKYTVKAVANMHDLTATFMPKPVFGINGSGMHTHMSLFGAPRGGKRANLFYNPKDEFLLSPLAYSFMAGLIEHARALAAIVAPSVNSYKRIVPGYEAPINLAYSSRNRSAAIRIPMYSTSPKAKRIEVRFPDPSCNGYLAFAAMLLAGLDGIQNKIDPGAPLDKDIYGLSPEELKDIPSACGSLEEALNALAGDHEFLLKGDVFTQDVIDTWIDYKKTKELDAVRLRPTPYEFFLYYDC